MDFKDAVYSRTSVRKFDSKEISEDILNEIVHYGLKAPSAKNYRPWEIYVITNKDVMQEFRNRIPSGNYNCNAMILVCGNKNRFIEGEGEGFWIQDASAAIENIILASTSFGIGSVWIGVYPIKAKIDSAKEILSLPENIIPLGLIDLGYPMGEVTPKNINDDDKIHFIK